MQKINRALVGTSTSCISRSIARLRDKSAGFRRDDSGALIIFGLIIFVLMLMIGGMAVDIMRFETVRTKLQSTSDRASLAAASLTQDMDATAVVNDYFAKEDLSGYLTGVTVDDAINYRSVTADVRAEVPSFFMQMVGVESLTAPANSTAEERKSDVEITLVLDVSGSMRSNGKLTNLKTAASAFVDTVLLSDVENKISISLVPFSGQVTLGPTVAANYALSTEHNLNTCVDFQPAEFGTPAVPPATTLTRSSPIDPWGSAWAKSSLTSVGFTAGVLTNYCSTEPKNVVRPFMRNIASLKAAINGLAADGNTSIDVGVKWGVAMLDPGTQPVINSLIGSAAVPANFAGRPYAYNRPDTAKVIVVMSDGENTDQYRLNAPYKSGASPVYRRASDGSLAIFHSSVLTVNKYYVIDKTKFSTSYTSALLGTWQLAVPAGYVNLTWPQVFDYHPITWVARYLYGNPLGTTSSTRSSIATTWVNKFKTATNPATKDAQMDTICDLAKSTALKIRVFTIAFEAPPLGQASLANCASSAGDYFNVAGLDITTAFQSIARQITQLRLTQ